MITEPVRHGFSDRFSSHGDPGIQHNVECAREADRIPRGAIK
jgi:hypothetical protein